jgi:hypothetical protein
VDTAAEDAVIGSKAMALMDSELAKFGLRSVAVNGPRPTPCAGIGGQAVIHSVRDVPTSVAGIHGILRFTVLQDTEFETPPLLLVSYLGAIHAIIDLGKGVLHTPDGHRTDMTRLPSGH